MASPLRIRGSVIFVADLAAMTKFYRAVTAWLITERGTNHIRLGMDGQELVIHKAFGVDVGEEVGPRVEMPLKLVLLAEDGSISETVEAEGGQLMRKRQWSDAGFVHLDAADPEGNIFQLVFPE
jgi:predicted enzyme related to lactoylglutathione lyase